MNGPRIWITSMSVLILASVSACGGGGGGGGGIGGSGNAPPQTSGISGIGYASGPVSTFGSVVVNGVRYETDTAEFFIDDTAGTQADLSVGQIVIVNGTINDDGVTGTADDVSFDDNVQGPVESIDIPMGQLVVLGQLVLVNLDTSFDDSISTASLEGLAEGDIVEVSGFVTSDGSILATRIEIKPAGSPFEVHGIVTNHDAANFTFDINSLVVDYSNASLDNDFPGGVISEGDLVEAKGSSLGAADELLATSIDYESFGISGAAGLHVEVEGLVTRFSSATDFDVNGTPVTTTGSTVFEGGVAADLGLNVKVEVEGELDANGITVADKVDIRRAKVVRATAIVDSVDVGTSSLVMLGITFSIDELTRLEDKSSADVDPLTINDISTGNYLEIRGGEFPAGSGQVLTTILERDDVDTRTILQGHVSSVTEPTLVILGVTVDTTGAVFRDVDDSVISATDFFNLAGVNTLVKARGTESGDTMISATEVELELEL